MANKFDNLTTDNDAEYRTSKNQAKTLSVLIIVAIVCIGIIISTCRDAYLISSAPTATIATVHEGGLKYVTKGRAKGQQSGFSYRITYDNKSAYYNTDRMVNSNQITIVYSTKNPAKFVALNGPINFISILFSITSWKILLVFLSIFFACIFIIILMVRNVGKTDKKVFNIFE